MVPYWQHLYILRSELLITIAAAFTFQSIGVEQRGKFPNFHQLIFCRNPRKPQQRRKNKSWQGEMWRRLAWHAYQFATTEEQTLLHGGGIFLRNWHSAVLFEESNNTCQQDTGRPILEADPSWAVEYVCPWQLREDKSWLELHSYLPIWSPGTRLSSAFRLLSKRFEEWWPCREIPPWWTQAAVLVDIGNGNGKHASH